MSTSWKGVLFLTFYELVNEAVCWIFSAGWPKAEWDHQGSWGAGQLNNGLQIWDVFQQKLVGILPFQAWMIFACDLASKVSKVHVARSCQETFDGYAPSFPNAFQSPHAFSLHVAWKPGWVKLAGEEGWMCQSEEDALVTSSRKKSLEALEKPRVGSQDSSSTQKVGLRCLVLFISLCRYSVCISVHIMQVGLGDLKSFVFNGLVGWVGGWSLVQGHGCGDSSQDTWQADGWGGGDLFVTFKPLGVFLVDFWVPLWSFWIGLSLLIWKDLGWAI